jgi:hypothetical protein
MADDGTAGAEAGANAGIDVVLPTGADEAWASMPSAANAPAAAPMAASAAAAAAAPAALQRQDSESKDFLAAARASAAASAAGSPAANDLAAAAKARKASILEHEAGAPGAEVPSSLEAFVNATSKLPAAANPAAAQQQHTVPVIGKTKGTPARRKDSFGKGVVGGEGKREKKRPPAPAFMSETWPPPKPASASKAAAASQRKKDGSASHRAASPRSHRAASPSPRGGGEKTAGGAPSAADGLSGGGTKESPRSPRASTTKKGGGAGLKSEEKTEKAEKKTKTKKSKRDKEAMAAALAETQKASPDAYLSTFLTHLMMHKAVGAAPPPVANEAWATCDLSDGFVPVADCLRVMNTNASLREVRKHGRRPTGGGPRAAAHGGGACQP